MMGLKLFVLHALYFYQLIICGHFSLPQFSASVPIAAARLVPLLSALDLESFTFRADRIAPIDRQRWASCVHAPSSGGLGDFANDEAVVVSSVLRAVKGDGKESIVLVAEWWLDADADGMWPSAPAIAVALQRHLQSCVLNFSLLLDFLIPRFF